MSTSIPFPKAGDLGPVGFGPAPELGNWARRTFIDDRSPLFNADHEHLAEARILWVWCGVPIKSKGRDVVGTAQMFRQSGGMGKKELLERLYLSWWDDPEDELPDFIITISSGYVREASPAAICALIEHELYHCDAMRDGDGEVVYRRGRVLRWQLRGHDVEEFFGVARRYGAATLDLLQLRRILDRGSGSAGCRQWSSCGGSIGLRVWCQGGRIAGRLAFGLILQGSLTSVNG